MGPAQLAGVLSIVARAAAEAQGQAVRRGGRRRHARLRRAVASRSSACRSSSPGCSTTTGSSTRATPAPCSAICLSVIENAPIRGHRPLRRLPDVTRAAITRRLARRQPGRDRPPGLRDLPRASASRPSPCTPTPTPGCRSCARPTSPCGCPATRPADTYLRGDLIVDAAPAIGCRRGPPRLRLPLRERRLRPRGHRRRADLGRADPGVDRADGLQGRGQEADGGGRRPGAAEVARRGRPTADLPLLVKASAGGGGRGMRVVRGLADLPGEVASRVGRGGVGVRRRRPSSVEPYVEHGRHVEVQVVGDTRRRAGARRAGLLDPAPAPEGRRGGAGARLPRRDPGRPARRRSRAAARGDRLRRRRARSSSCSTPGTARFFFLEMNTRLQVEHPVTELVTGARPGRAAAPVAEGGRVPRRAALGDDRRPRRSRSGCTPRTRPRDWQPQSGRAHRFEVPEQPANRDVRRGRRVRVRRARSSTFYDAMLAKVVATAPTREAAARRLAAALARARIHGVAHQPRPAGRGAAVARRSWPASVSTAFLDEPRGLATGAARRPRRSGPLPSPRRSRWPSRRGAARTVQRGIPVGWRNVAVQPQRTEFDGRHRPSSGWRRPRRLRRRRASVAEVEVRRRRPRRPLR